MTADPAARADAPVLSADELVETALRMSECQIDDYLSELGDPSLDRQVLLDACERLRKMESPDARDRAVQHMAFSLVSALFERARRQHRYRKF